MFSSIVSHSLPHGRPLGGCQIGVRIKSKQIIRRHYLNRPNSENHREFIMDDLEMGGGHTYETKILGYRVRSKHVEEVGGWE